MPPKKGKKGKNNKKSKVKQKISLTPKEEILSYQIQIKEDYQTNLNFELEKIKEDNEKISQKLQVFRRDKEEFANEMIRKFRELGVNSSKKNIYQKSDVTNCMKSNWVIERVEKQDIITVQNNIDLKDKKIRDLELKIASLKYIRNDEIKDNNHQIKVLKQILDDMDGNFSAIKKYLEKAYFEKKSELIDKEKSSTETFQKNASIKASKVIKDDMKQEFADNNWLIDKRNVHKETFEILKCELENIERENIELNEKIFQLKQSDKKFTNLFMTEIEPDEILFNEGILEYNINHVFNMNVQNTKSVFMDVSKTNEPILSKSIERNADLSYSSWKDYLNLNPVNFDFLYVTGNLLEIQEVGPKTAEEIHEETFTIKILPVNVHSLPDNLINNS